MQVSISDVNSNVFSYREDLSSKSPIFLDSAFNFTSGDKSMNSYVTAYGGNGLDHLYFQNSIYALDLDLTSMKLPTVHYDGRIHDYTFGGYTYYYSRTNMNAEGTLSIDNIEYEVKGKTWFDRQYGNLARAITQGWQWFSLTLDDGREIMIFDFNYNDGDEDGKEENYGSVTMSDGSVTTLHALDIKVVVTGQWSSYKTNCTYPSGWTINVSSSPSPSPSSPKSSVEAFTITPYILDQELGPHDGNERWTSPIYWEGISKVSDTEDKLVGTAYVELNGYCPQLGTSNLLNLEFS